MITLKEKNQIISEVSARNPEYKKLVNEVFSNVFEGLIISIFEYNKDNLINLNNLEDNKFLNSIKECSQLIIKSKIELGLYIKEIYSLNSFLLFQEYYEKNEKYSIDTIKEYLELINKDREDINQKNYEEAIENLKKEYELIDKCIENKNILAEIIIPIFINKYKQITDINYREELFKIILSKSIFIIKSKILFNLFFGDDILIKEKEEEEDCLIEFDIEDDKINSLINKNKENIVLNEVLLYLFENSINSYFENCGNKIKEKKDNNNKFILKEPFKYFKICIEYLDNNENDNILNVLYYIAYVKCFLNKFIDLIYHNINELGDIREFNDYLISKDNKFRKVIKLYILKIFYILYFKNFKDFIENDWDHHQIKYKSEFKFEENFCNLEYLFIDINKKDDFDNLLNKFNQIQENGFREYSKNIKDEIINNNNLLIFYDICVYKMISNLINKNYLNDFSYIYTDFCNFSQFIFKDLNQNTKKILDLYQNILKIIIKMRILK